MVEEGLRKLMYLLRYTHPISAPPRTAEHISGGKLLASNTFCMILMEDIAAHQYSVTARHHKSLSADHTHRGD